MNKKIEELRLEIKAVAEKIEILNSDNIVEDDEYCDLKNYRAYDDNFGKTLEDYDITLYTSPHFNFYESEGIVASDDQIRYLESILEGMKTWFDAELDSFEEVEEDQETKFEIMQQVLDYESEKVAKWQDDELDTISWNEIHIVRFSDGSTFIQHDGGWRKGIMSIEDDENEIKETVDRIKNGENIKEDILEIFKIEI